MEKFIFCLASGACWDSPCVSGSGVRCVFQSVKLPVTPLRSVCAF